VKTIERESECITDLYKLVREKAVSSRDLYRCFIKKIRQAYDGLSGSVEAILTPLT